LRPSFNSSKAGNSSSSNNCPENNPTAVIKPKLAVGIKPEKLNKPNCAINNSDTASTARPEDSKLRAIANMDETPTFKVWQPPSVGKLSAGFHQPTIATAHPYEGRDGGPLA